MIKKNVQKVILAIILITSIVIVLKNPHMIGPFLKPTRIKEYILSFGSFSSIVFITLYSLRSLLIVFPIWIFAIVSSSVFGFYLGFIYSMIGAFISASIAFFTSKYFFKDITNKYLSDKINILKNQKLSGFKLILFLRLIMIMPYDAFSYAVGATQISYKEFIFGTMLGIIPEFLAYAYIGYIGLGTGIPLKSKIIYLAIIVLIFLVIQKIKGRFRNKPNI